MNLPKNVKLTPYNCLTAWSLTLILFPRNRATGAPAVVASRGPFPDYPAACAERDQAMRTGKYESAWIRQVDKGWRAGQRALKEVYGR